MPVAAWMVITWSTPSSVSVLSRVFRGRTRTRAPPSSFKVLPAPAKIPIAAESAKLSSAVSIVRYTAPLAS